MNQSVLTEIPIELHLAEVKDKMHIRKESDRQTARLKDLIEQAQRIAKPKAVYKMAFVDELDGESVVINNTRFQSRVLRSNLENIDRVFPFAVTCGKEIEEWSKDFKGSILENYLVEGIKEIILYKAAEFMAHKIHETFATGKLSFMNPGSLPDWPLSEQVPLLSIIGDVENLIGVKLTENYLLIPLKSSTGIFFPSEIGYENCMLCLKEQCPNRRAPFDAQLYKEKLQ